MGLLAQGIADQELAGGPPRAGDVAALESVLGDVGEEILVQVGHPLAIGGEALVAETLEQIAGIDPQRPFLIVRVAARGEPFEAIHVELDDGVPVEPDRVLVGLEPGVGIDAGSGQARPDQPQRLAERGRRRDAGFRPQLGRERVAQTRPGTEREEGDQRLSVPAADPDRHAAGVDVEATEQTDREGVASAHQTPIWFDGCARRSPQRPGAAVERDCVGPPGPGSPACPRDGQPLVRPSVCVPPGQSTDNEMLVAPATVG